MSYDSEKALISAGLINRRDISVARVTGDQFKDSRLGKVWDLMVKLDRDGVQADPVIIVDTLHDPAIDISLLTDTFALSGNPGLIEQYSEAIVADHAERCAREQIASLLTDKEKHGKEFVNEVEEIGQRVRVPERSSLRKAGDTVVQTYKQLEEAVNSGRYSIGLPTGFEAIDRQVGGIPSGVVTIVGARTSVGKSALSCAIAANVAATGKRVHYYSLEDSQTGVDKRLIARVGRIADFDSSRGGVRPERLEAIKRATDEVGKLNLHVCTEMPSTASRFCQMVLGHARENHPDLVVVDYIHCLSEPKLRVGRTEELSYISRCIKKLAKDIDCAFLVNAQLRRFEGDHRPDLQDLRESGALEQDAHVVILLHRPYPMKVVEALIEKNKDGPRKVAILQWVPEYVTFEDCPLHMEEEYRAAREQERNSSKSASRPRGVSSAGGGSYKPPGALYYGQD